MIPTTLMVLYRLRESALLNFQLCMSYRPTGQFHPAYFYFCHKEQATRDPFCHVVSTSIMHSLITVVNLLQIHWKQAFGLTPFYLMCLKSPLHRLSSPKLFCPTYPQLSSSWIQADEINTSTLEPLLITRPLSEFSGFTLCHLLFVVQ